MQEGVLGGVSK